MPLYRVMIEGRRVETRVDDRPVAMGFYAVRWVRAGDRYAAGRDGLAVVWRELLPRPVLNSEAAPPQLSIEDVIEAREEPAQLPGFIWFPEEGRDGR